MIHGPILTWSFFLLGTRVSERSDYAIFHSGFVSRFLIFYRSLETMTYSHLLKWDTEGHLYRHFQPYLSTSSINSPDFIFVIVRFRLSSVLNFHRDSTVTQIGQKGSHRRSYFCSVGPWTFVRTPFLSLEVFFWR